MDQIEFRPMNNGIQTTGSAMLIDPASQGNYGCSGKGCGHNNDSGYGFDRDCGKDNNYDRGSDKDKDKGSDNGYGRSKDQDNNYGRSKDQDNGHGRSSGGCNGSGNCNTRTTETGGDGHIYYRGCEEAKIKVMPDRELDQTGRVLDITMTLRNVCPCRHVSVGYLVTELDEDSNEHACGFKAFTVEPHYNARACDMELDSVRFILPDDARVGNGTRHFVVRADAHYADTAVSMT